MDRRLIEILKTYQTKLTNLSASNKSLLQLRTYKYADLDLHELNFLNTEPSIKIVEKLLLQKVAPLCPIDDPRSEQNNLNSKKIRQILNRTKFIQNERGSDDLYLGYPFVEGKLKSDFSVRCPLLFIPVKIIQQKNQWQLQPNHDAPIKFNKSFLLAYAFYHETSLDRMLEDLEVEDLNFDNLRTFLTQLYEVLKTSAIALNFNQELFEEQLKYFHNYKKADFEEQHQEGVLKLQPYAVLGIYPQAGSNLFSDYEKIIQNCTYEDLEAYFATKTTESIKNKEESFFTPLAIDASQEETIKTLRSGKSIVVQGPPGTGKSQLIAQVIADYIANGKKVLLACDKRVALDVVYQRLEHLGLAPYMGLVHDHQTDRKTLYEKISHQIENLEHIQNQNNRYDTIALERDFLQASRRITQIEETLDGFKNALFDIEPFGVSVKYLYVNTGLETTLLKDIEVAKDLDFPTLNQLLIKLKYWLLKAQIFEKEDFVLKDRLGFEQFQGADRSNLYNAYVEKNRWHEHITETTQTIFGKKLHILDFEALFIYRQSVSDMFQLVIEEATYDLFTNYNTKKLRKERLNDFYQQVQQLLHLGVVQNFEPSSLDREKECTIAALDLLEKSFGKLRYLLTYKHRKELDAILKKYGISLEKTQLAILKNKIAHTEELLTLYNNLRKAGFKLELTDLENTYALDTWYQDQTKALDAVEIFKTLPESHFGFLLTQHHAVFVKHVQIFIELHTTLSDPFLNIRKYLSNSQLIKLDDLDHVKNTLQLYFDEICEFDRFTQGLTNIEQTLSYAALQSNHESIDTRVSSLKNNVYRYWIALIEEKYPILKSVSTGYIPMLEEELKELLKEKQRLSKEIVVLKASEKSYQGLVYNRLGNRTTYRDLLHETTKKKKIKSVRQLFAEHEEEILQIIPCWMASPETVSAVFPNTAVFDLVIFDEASQCFTEEAVPTLFRGKQILIAGDSKQLPPSDLYRPRWEEEDESIDEQTHSLLDLACRYLPQTMLCEHYRSLSYELIQFSNEKFYRNKLRLVPDLKYFNNGKSALEYVYVYGTWQNQSNYIEAVECLRLVKKYSTQSPEKSLGIITFNFKQQELIQELLIDDSIAHKYVLPEQLFVKNIENVQGDERDIIIFSIGYAPNEDGKMVHSFGSLALQGGEKRLNVAITRAKEKMYLVTSILPQQLATENAKNQGPLLLKEYLQYAWNLSDGASVPNMELQVGAKDSLSQLLRNDYRKANANFADLIEYTNDKATAAIITDDNLYYQSRSSKEIHGYVPSTLINKNWIVKKYYSREYFEGKLK